MVGQAGGRCAGVAEERVGYYFRQNRRDGNKEIIIKIGFRGKLSGN